MRPSRGSKRAPGMEVAMNPPSSKGARLSWRPRKTSVGTRIRASAGVASSSENGRIGRAALAGEAARRWISLKAWTCAGVASGRNCEVNVCRKAGLSWLQTSSTRRTIATRASRCSSTRFAVQPAACEGAAQDEVAHPFRMTCGTDDGDGAPFGHAEQSEALAPHRLDHAFQRRPRARRGRGCRPCGRRARSRGSRGG